jgi:hypothetical protein
LRASYLFGGGGGCADLEWNLINLGAGCCADLEWKLIYVGSAEDEKYDQVLESVLVGPLNVGNYRFVFQVPRSFPLIHRYISFLAFVGTESFSCALRMCSGCSPQRLLCKLMMLLGSLNIILSTATRKGEGFVCHIV